MPDPRPSVLSCRLAALLSTLVLAALWGSTTVSAAAAAPVRIAVAANFKSTLDRLASEFSMETSQLAPIVSAGATGLLYGQIVQGAPFDLFFAADRERPARLIAAGLAEPASRRTYAVGRLVAWRPGRPWRGTLVDVLGSQEIRVVAIANPEIAPYGAAAAGLLGSPPYASLPPRRIVQGESLGQTFQFVASGNAQLGFIALAQVRESPPARRAAIEAESLVIDPGLYPPIQQDVVLLRSARNPEVARRFLDFVASRRGRAIIEAAGYAVPP